MKTNQGKFLIILIILTNVHVFNLSGLDIKVIRAMEIGELGNGESDYKSIIAVLDTGLDKNNIFIKDMIWENEGEEMDGIDNDDNGYIDDLNGWNFVDDVGLVMDDNELSHGTHVSGIIAGQEVGTTINCKIMVLKAFDNEGKATDEAVRDAIKYAYENGADIISISASSKENIDIIRDEIIKAKLEDVIIVAAAGNEKGYVSFPASLNEVIAVGSVNTEGELSEFTGRGEEIDMLAPGEHINSTVRVGRGIRGEMYYEGIKIYVETELGTALNDEYEDYQIMKASKDNLQIINASSMYILYDDTDQNIDEVVSFAEDRNINGIIFYGNKTVMERYGAPSTNLVMLRIANADGKWIEKDIGNNSTVTIKTESSDFMKMSGTSMATPSISAIVAEIKNQLKDMGRYKGLEQVETILFNGVTSDIYGKQGNRGYGIPDPNRISELIRDNEVPNIVVEEIGRMRTEDGIQVEIRITVSDNYLMDHVIVEYDHKREKFTNQRKENTINRTIAVELGKMEEEKEIIITTQDMAGNQVSEKNIYYYDGGLNKKNTNDGKIRYFGMIGISALIFTPKIRRNHKNKIIS